MFKLRLISFLINEFLDLLLDYLHFILFHFVLFIFIFTIDYRSI